MLAKDNIGIIYHTVGWGMSKRPGEHQAALNASSSLPDFSVILC